MKPLPWVVGQWVRGPRFYGRQDLLATLEAARREVRWVAGCRRVGKTSLLREIERRALVGDDPSIPLYVDLQGVCRAIDLDHAVRDAVLDLEPAAAARIDDLGSVAGLGAAESIERLAQRSAERHLRLLVLVDEPEALLVVAEADPDAVADLGATLAGHAGATTVCASSPRFAPLVRRAPPLAWLEPALASPLWIGPLSGDEAASLVGQDQLPLESRPALPPGGRERVLDLAGGHPYLLQLLAKRVAEDADPSAAERTIEFDPAVRWLVDVDLRLLSEDDCATVAAVVAGACVPSSGDRIDVLIALGLVRRTAAGRLVPGNAAVARFR